MLAVSTVTAPAEDFPEKISWIPVTMSSKNSYFENRANDDVHASIITVVRQKEVNNKLGRNCAVFYYLEALSPSQLLKLSR